MNTMTEMLQILARRQPVTIVVPWHGVFEDMLLVSLTADGVATFRRIKGVTKPTS